MDKSESCSVGGACGVGLLGLLCPFCIPALGAFLASIGLGVFATKEAVISMLVLFSVLLLFGLYTGYKLHKNVYPLLLGIVAVIAIPVGRYAVGILTLTYIGVAIALGATIWNIVLDQKRKSSS